MIWVWLGIAITLGGTTADSVWHLTYGFPAEQGIPYPHYIVMTGIVMSLASCVSMLRLTEGRKRLWWFGAVMIALELSGSLWDNLVYHSRGIYGAPLQEIPHTMEGIGGILWLLTALVISVNRMIQRTHERTRGTRSS
ncbi:hypothetical protein [Paenibacillus puerhi]|uniref:hypothetical protein n=1 Tax=Paenibacillus puerhi TaxID=2692622 RepID=UPI0013567E6F|nr:hypothetical protein [Paenibacillus puerhi]